MRVCVDLDGTICTLAENGDYASVKPLPRAVETLKKLKAQGHYIIIYTARRMRSQNGDVSRVIEEVGKLTTSWLKDHDVPYDELIFGKPYAHVYIDDLAVPFTSWEKIVLPSESGSSKQSC